MTNFLVIEVQIWLFLLILLLVLAGLAAAAFFGWRRLKRREAALRESIETAAAEDSLAKRNRMLIRLDHELKNPLTALRTSAATIREVSRQGGTLAEVEPSAKQVDISSRRVARLLADLRKLADVETRIIEYSRVDLDRLIHQAVEDASTAPGAEDRMIVATVARAPWRLPDVAGEEDLLLTAILNLLGNALKYSSQAEVVELRANEQIIDNHRWVVVEVADTGSGIPLGEQDQVWDELSRGSRVRAVAGSGMGLSLVRSIVARHGGSVQLFSQEGVGTSVRMVLPVLADADPVGAPPMAEGGAHAAAGSHPVQPVQNPDMRHAPGFLPPRQPSEAELNGRILGTPRRTSKRRLERVDGTLIDRSTGESVGSGSGFPVDSGQHSQFKPGTRSPQSGQPQGGSPQSDGVPVEGQPQSGGVPVGSQPQGRGVPAGAPQPNSGPQRVPHGGRQADSGPQQRPPQQGIPRQQGVPQQGIPQQGAQSPQGRPGVMQQGPGAQRPGGQPGPQPHGGQQPVGSQPGGYPAQGAGQHSAPGFGQGPHQGVPGAPGAGHQRPGQGPPAGVPGQQGGQQFGVPEHRRFADPTRRPTPQPGGQPGAQPGSQPQPHDGRQAVGCQPQPNAQAGYGNRQPQDSRPHSGQPGPAPSESVHPQAGQPGNAQPQGSQPGPAQPDPAQPDPAQPGAADQPFPSRRDLRRRNDSR